MTVPPIDPAQEEAAMAAYMQQCFGIRGFPTDSPVIPAGGVPAVSDEDQQFAAYMRHHFTM